jgi:hypothetical protein
MTRAIAVFIASIAAVAVLALAVSLRGGDDFNADQAWTDRLNGQAQAAQDLARTERADGAYRARLAAQADAYFDRVAQREQGDRAWTDRLNELARENGAEAGMSPRVAAAWTARLNGLAAEAASGQ